MRDTFGMRLESGPRCGGGGGDFECVCAVLSAVLTEMHTKRFFTEFGLGESCVIVISLCENRVCTHTLRVVVVDAKSKHGNAHTRMRAHTIETWKDHRTGVCFAN